MHISLCFLGNKAILYENFPMTFASKVIGLCTKSHRIIFFIRISNNLQELCAQLFTLHYFVLNTYLSDSWKHEEVFATLHNSSCLFTPIRFMKTLFMHSSCRKALIFIVIQQNMKSEEFFYFCQFLIHFSIFLNTFFTPPLNFSKTMTIIDVTFHS